MILGHNASMASTHIEMSSLAFIKLQLHLAKYHNCSVNGLMLACKQRFTQDHVIEIVDIPLFHQCLQLTPMLEIALSHIDLYCAANELLIAGYYEATDLLKSKPEMSLFATKIADKIKGNFAETCLVIINNQKVPGPNSLVFYSSEGSSKKWTKREDQVDLKDVVLDNLRHLLEQKVYRDLVDFDNHLCDLSQYWLNQPINKLVLTM